jgi:threonine dehydrogenase-like Zn-dependent dehydrogenase
VIAASDHPGWEGKRVVGDINVSCGRCQMCLMGRPHHCERRRTLGISDYDGCFAEYCVLPVANLFEVPSGIPDEAAVFSEPLAAALEIQEQVQIFPGTKVLVIGAGRLGMLIALSLNLTGCEMVVVARHERSQALLVANQISAIYEKEVRSHQADLVVDATGTPDGFSLACKAVRPGGKIVIKSTFKGKTELNLSALVVDEVSLVGSRCGPHPAALRLMEEKAIDPRVMIDRMMALSDGLKAFDLAATPGTLKILMDPAK